MDLLAGLPLDCHSIAIRLPFDCHSIAFGQEDAELFEAEELRRRMELEERLREKREEEVRGGADVPNTRRGCTRARVSDAHVHAYA